MMTAMQQFLWKMILHSIPSHQLVIPRTSKKVVLVGGGNWITGAIQDKIFLSSIDFHALKHVMESDITGAVGNWRLKVELEDPLSINK